MKYFDIIHKIIKKNDGYITHENINDANIPSIYFYRYIKKYKLDKICAGIYIDKSWIVDDYFVFQYQYPKFVYSFYSAAYLHGLGDFMPPFLEVTGPKNYRPFKLPRKGVNVHTSINPKVYSLGITKIKTALGNEVAVYDIEKTVCDFIKNREKIDIESFIKCINCYKKRKDKDVNKLMDYAKVMKIEKKVKELMEVVLNVD